MDTSLRRLRLRYPGKCVLCGIELVKDSLAFYDPKAKTVRCVECPSSARAAPIDAGTAGGSARHEYERRRAAREARVKAQLGNFVGGIALVLAGEPQSTRAWERGAVGETRLASALAGLDGIALLHDRRVPGTRGNIDHIVVARSGVFVVDAKHYAGLIQIRDRGGLFSSDKRLYVGGRDCSDLAGSMEWQTWAVGRLLESLAGELGPIPVQPVLCFIDGEWPLILPPESFRGVRLESGRSIKKLLGAPGPLDPATVDRIARALAAALPAKQRV